MKTTIAFAALLASVLPSMSFTSRADIVLSAGYLNNLTEVNPADLPNPFDPSATTTLIASGDSNSPHDTGVLWFFNDCPDAVTIDPGLNVTTQGAVFQIWDGALPFVLGPGQNLVLAQTATFNFDSSDFGLGTNPVVSGSVNGVAFSFEDTLRILLGHEEAGNGPETTPYGELGRISCVPESPVDAVIVVLSLVGAHCGLRRRIRPGV